MMRYSNWLIDVKNRARLRDACGSTPDPDADRIHGGVETQNNNHRQLQPDQKPAELPVRTHLWRKGEKVRVIVSLERDISSGITSDFTSPPRVKAEGEGVLRYQDNGCRDPADMRRQKVKGMQCYKLIKKIGEGTFSEVLKTQSLRDGKFYACKTMKQTINSLEQASNLREVQAMKRLSPHANIVQLHELIYDKRTGTVSLICELMEMNIYELIQGRQTPLPEYAVKSYMYQLCRSLAHMHSCGIFHRDVKPENILIKQNVLKLGDFGSCRSVFSKPPHTEYISTRWYRAPECLLTDGYYGLKMDIWSAGCVLFEVMSLNPLFPGTNELDQVAKIHNVLGTPDQSLLQKFKQSRAMHFSFPPKKGSGISRLLPACPAPALSLLYQMLAYDPDERISAETALRHTYFREIRMGEKKSETLERVSENVDGMGNTVTSKQIWRPTRLGKQLRGRQPRQTPLINHNVKRAAEPLIRRNAPHPAELTRLHMVPHGPQFAFPFSTMPAFPLNHRATLPPITPKKCQSHVVKAQDEPPRITFCLPPVDQKNGEKKPSSIG